MESIHNHFNKTPEVPPLDPTACLEKEASKQAELVRLLVETYPKLSQVKVETYTPSDSFEAGGFYDLSLNDKGECVATIYISEGGPILLEKLFASRKETVVLTAALLGLSLEEMTPEILELFILTHEYGHLFDFFTNYQGVGGITDEEAIDDMHYHRENNLETLPVAGVYPPILARDMSETSHPLTQEELFVQFPSLLHHPKGRTIKNAEDLLTLQQQEYRAIPAEMYADTFARNFLLLHKELFVTKVTTQPLQQKTN